ncbi:MAG TPA: PQQ-binding-like beta-propeller repeat protein [Armatimonadota bacterium]|jgi:outer membrane protein assembly factor BamB
MKAIRKYLGIAAILGLTSFTVRSAELRPAWTFPAAGHIAPVNSSPTVFHDVVYVGSDDGKLYALYAVGDKAGTLLPGFPIALDGSVKGRPAVYGASGQETVYVATARGSLYAFALNGQPAWGRNPQPVSPGIPILTTPAVRGKYIYLTASNGRISRRNAADGSAAGGLTYGRTFVTSLPRRQAAPPAQSYLEVTDASGLFPAGRVNILGADAVGSPAVYEYTYSGRNTAVRPNRLLNVAPVGSGGPLLAHPKGAAVFGFGPGAACTSSPSVPGSDNADLVIAGVDTGASGPRVRFADRDLVGLKSDAFGLVPQWEVSYGARIATEPVVDEKTGALFVGAWEDGADPKAGARIYRLTASNGQVDSRWPNGGYVRIAGATIDASPWLDRAGQVLYFGATDGSLSALNAADGSTALPPNVLDGAAGSFHSTPLVVNDKLYIGSHSGRFYAVPVRDPGAFAAFADPDRGPLDSSPSASGCVAGRDVVVVGSAAGKILAFPIQP